MRLTNNNFSYCKKVGMLKENFTREQALKELYEDMVDTPDLDKAFLEEFKKVTTTSSNAGTWVAVMYSYDIDVNYKIQGKTLSKTVNGFGNTGTPDALKVTKYYGDGEYKTLTDVGSQCSFPVWNENNIFSYDEMKGALKNIIDDELPQGWQSYETTDWSVSAFLVPIFSIDIKVYGKEYTVNYNLHNGEYNYKYPIDKQLISKSKKASRLGTFVSIACLVVSIACLLLSFATLSNKAYRAIISAAAVVYNIVMVIKYKKKESYWRDYFAKHSDKGVAKAILPVLIGVGITLVFGFITLL